MILLITLPKPFIRTLNGLLNNRFLMKTMIVLTAITYSCIFGSYITRKMMPCSFVANVGAKCRVSSEERILLMFEDKVDNDAFI